MSDVLIVDDDQQTRKFIRRVLEKEDIHALEASNGKEGLSLYRTLGPMVVLIDIIMPEKDGLSTIKDIKEYDGNAKIIAISGGLVLVPQAYLDEAMECGADAALSKPIDRRQLVLTVKNFLNMQNEEPVLRQ